MALGSEGRAEVGGDGAMASGEAAGGTVAAAVGASRAAAVAAAMPSPLAAMPTASLRVCSVSVLPRPWMCWDLAAPSLTARQRQMGGSAPWRRKKGSRGETLQMEARMEGSKDAKKGGREAVFEARERHCTE